MRYPLNSSTSCATDTEKRVEREVLSPHERTACKNTARKLLTERQVLPIDKQRRIANSDFTTEISEGLRDKLHKRQITAT